MRADPPRLNRRALLAAPIALAACDRFAAVQPAAGPLAPSLKSIAPFPVGATGMTGQLDDPVWVAAMRNHVDQITPEWELKPERILQPGFAFDFSASDRMVDWGREQGLRVFGHCLVWYSQGLDHFTDALPAARFAAEFDRYVSTVAGRYRGRMVGWDVVNEAVAEDGDGLRDCVYARRLGPEAYIVRAFEQARDADPDAVLFLNDYNLENIPTKGATFLRLVERLLKLGAPIGGLGTQSHLNIEIPAGQITTFMRDAASLGLPIHVSELDFPMQRDGGRMPDLRSTAERRAQQIARVGELAEAFMALPERQRFAFTTWGLRDNDSWLVREEGKNRPDESALLLDAEGRPNPAYQAVVDAFTGRAGA
ncbi:MAG: endo-1,4-beta-xylanase [Brevundimonas sp.]|uniref:endo-1,4-beta-xylanase n=1 Tax=Brevundimonas sp. TaxID=1871086 RepID=UPI002618022A|nr:endo-1,4-beta-xylanase [Brevundimonas sp.]MDI6624781.1 endo-1,4-beta-xylanase [Brevundimonas sp.]MDQ7812738.1 endo-1,4-beta-xylanase [Brevundimonas sp.]